MAFSEDLAQAPSIRLQALDEARGVRRAYAIHRTTDLFGHTIVDWSWGRIGTRGQQRRAVFEEADDAVCFVRQLLRRRGTAERRIGTAYRQVEAGGGALVEAARPPAPAPAAPSHANPFCPVRRAMVVDLRYRLMRFALGLGTGKAEQVEIKPWGPCAPAVRAMLTDTRAPVDSEPGSAVLGLEDALAFVARLEAEAPHAVFPGQPSRRMRGFGRGRSPVRRQTYGHGPDPAVDADCDWQG